MLDLEAVIRPGVSAAGITVHLRIEAVLTTSAPEEIKVLFLDEGLSYREITVRPGLSAGAVPTDAVTQYSFGSVVVWVRHGRVYQVGVCAGYLGKTVNGIGIGSTISQVETAFGAPVIEDDEDFLIAAGSSGWCFITEEWTAPFTVASNRDARIEEILVFAGVSGLTNR